MARFETSAGIDELTGKFNRQTNLTMRQKRWRYPDGRIFGYGPKEVYSQKKRDYRRSPRTPAEQVQYEKWTKVCQEASLITKDPTHPRHAEMTARYEAQLRGKPEPMLGKRICMYGNFVRSVLAHEG